MILSRYVSFLTRLVGSFGQRPGLAVRDARQIPESFFSPYRKFSYRGANFRIRSDRYDCITQEIVKQRRILSDYIGRHPEFLTALTPVKRHADAPTIARRMHTASESTGIGPMAAVAGTTAQMAAEAALAAGGTEAVVENGGDIYISSPEEVVIGLYAGESPLSGKLGLGIQPGEMPLAVCSSSGRMGHSLSLGDCDLATVTSDDASIADAAATLACNLVSSIDDVDPVMAKILAIPGVRGVLIIKDERIGISGRLPALVKHTDHQFSDKITRDKDSYPPNRSRKSP